jgi:hypothetical protein
MRMPNAAKIFFRGHKHDPTHSEDPSLFDAGIGDWIFDLTAVALIVLVAGTIIRWAYLAIFYK